MPTYEYACPKCGHHFEQYQTMSAAPLRKCPKCGKSGVKRLIGAGAGLIFKGSGFYSTDYRKGAPPKEGGEAKSGAAEGKPEGKPAEGKPASAEVKPAPAKTAAAQGKKSQE